MRSSAKSISKRLFTKSMVVLGFACLSSHSSFPASRKIAIKYLNQLNFRLNKNPNSKVAYNKVMQEYLYLKHIELVPSDEIEKNDVYYIAYNPVFHNEKIRIVFNASTHWKNTGQVSAWQESICRGTQANSFRAASAWARKYLLLGKAGQCNRSLTKQE